jgi:hypothetical protein
MKRFLPILLLASACVDQQPGIEGTQSLVVTLADGTVPGTPDEPRDSADRSVTISIEARNEDNEIDTTFTADVDVYVQFLGGLTPSLGSNPLARVAVEGGVAVDATIELPPVFGATFLWVEDGSGESATYATGTSPVLWFRDPFLEDISRPENEMALDALEASPLQGKQVGVTGSRYGADGRLIVTGVYAQGYTVSDAQCGAGGAAPCVTGEYDHVFVFSFSRPRDERGRNIAVGQVIDGFAGAAEEFNGLTEIGFPQTFVEADDPFVDEALIPEPAVLDSTWLTNTIEMERHESALIAVEGATLCELDAEYDTYKQWKLDVGRGCGQAINVITAGVVDFDPANYVGMQLPRVVGTMRPVNIGSFNVWIMYPRNSADLTLP